MSKSSAFIKFQSAFKKTLPLESSGFDPPNDGEVPGK